VEFDGTEAAFQLMVLHEQIQSHVQCTCVLQAPYRLCVSSTSLILGLGQLADITLIPVTVLVGTTTLEEILPLHFAYSPINKQCPESVRNMDGCTCKHANSSDVRWSHPRVRNLQAARAADNRAFTKRGSQIKFVASI
jgi:hypothetical protein